MKTIKTIWYKLSIKRKLMLFFTLIIVCISFLNLYTLSNAFKYLKIYEQDLIKNTTIHILQTSIIENNADFENYIMYSGNSALSNFNKKIPQIWSNWVSVKETSNTNKDASFQIFAIRYAFIAYLESVENTLKAVDSSENFFINHLLKSRRINGYIENYLKELVRIRLEEGSQLHSVQIEKVILIRTISFLGIIFISVLFLIFGTVFSESVTKPIRELADRSLKIAEGDIEISNYKIPYQDELGILTNSFNKMNTNIHEMIKSLEGKVEIEKRLREDELKISEMNQSLKEAQFLSLQSQINPHFLFNTLNTISRTSMFEKAPETVKLIDSLSNIFRYTLNKQSHVVTLLEELDILKEYMHIQKVRYGARLNFQLDIDTNISKVKLPVFTLQPLVENSIKYAIEPREEGGTISLRITSDHDSVNIQIKDNGIGIPEKILSCILSEDDNISMGQSTGIGITNVQRRLKIAFKGKAVFSIDSNFSYGTDINIILPGDSDVQTADC
jgi:two-component system, sensor histidine kinase YesM